MPHSRKFSFSRPHFIHHRPISIDLWSFGSSQSTFQTLKVKGGTHHNESAKVESGKEFSFLFWYRSPPRVLLKTYGGRLWDTFCSQLKNETPLEDLSFCFSPFPAFSTSKQDHPKLSHIFAYLIYIGAVLLWSFKPSDLARWIKCSLWKGKITRTEAKISFRM